MFVVWTVTLSVDMLGSQVTNNYYPMSLLDELLVKIKEAEFVQEPFPHLHIKNFLPDAVFQQITRDHTIRLRPVSSLDDLHLELVDKGWNIQRHPGCALSFDEYSELRRQKLIDASSRLCGDNSQKVLCEGAGLTYRLSAEATSSAQQLVEIFNSLLVRSCLLDKFEIDEPCAFDTGIQKYLDCYEISPHPDVREKALTFMLNLNTPEASSKANYHTHFMRFIPQYEYIYSFWEQCPAYQRCWVPWEWCQTTFLQTDNNSITIFRPSSFTLHAVKADYDDLASQRTQLYGNIWFKEKKHALDSTFMDIDLHAKNNLLIHEASQDNVQSESSSLSKLSLFRLLKSGLRRFDIQ